MPLDWTPVNWHPFFSLPLLPPFLSCCLFFLICFCLYFFPSFFSFLTVRLSLSISFISLFPSIVNSIFPRVLRPVLLIFFFPSYVSSFIPSFCLSFLPSLFHSSFPFPFFETNLKIHKTGCMRFTSGSKLFLWILVYFVLLIFK